MADSVELLIRIRTEGKAALDAVTSSVGGLNTQTTTAASSVAKLDQSEVKLTVSLRQAAAATDAASAATARQAAATEVAAAASTKQAAIEQKAAEQKALNAAKIALLAAKTAAVEEAAAARAAAIAAKDEAFAAKKVAAAKKAADAAEAAANAESRHAESMTLSVIKGTLLVSVLERVASSVKAATVDAAMYAARTEQLNSVMDQMARSSNLSVNAVRAQADAVKALGITTQESRNTISQMIQGQLDLSKATDLARLAQNAAKIAGISSSEALSGIINGIKTQQIEVLRTYGIQVSFEQALSRGAAKMGKTRETLTDYERANIALNEVLSKGPRIMGAYEVSLTTAAGQMQSLSRLTDEAKNALGEQFAPALQRTVELLTRMAEGVRDNADTVGDLTIAITAAGAAAAAARYVPGPPQVKAAAALVTGAAVAYFGNTDPEAAALDSAKSAIGKLEAQKQALARKVQNGLVTDREKYVTEIERLSKLELVIQQDLADKLAVVYKAKQAKQDAFLKNPPAEALGLLPASANVPIPDFQLGGGRVLKGEEVRSAFSRSTTIDPNGLKFTPDPNANIDAQFASFSAKVKEAQQTASAALERAKSSELSGEARILAERQAALNRIATTFKPFDAALRGGAEYQRLLGTINAEYAELLKKEQRGQRIDTLKQNLKVADVQSQIQGDATRQSVQIAQQIASAKRDPGNEEANILQLYKDRIALANQDKQISDAKNRADFAAAQAIFELDKNKKALDEAAVNFRIGGLKSEAQLTKEKNDADADKQVAILKLRQDQRKELEKMYENVARLVESERQIGQNRFRDSVNRNIRLVQAQGLGGDERFSQEYAYAGKVAIAKEEFRVTKETLEEQRKASIDAYTRTKDRVELERKQTEYRIKSEENSYKLEKELLDARFEREIQIAEIRKKQNEELRASLGSLYDAAKASGKTGIQDFFKNYVEQIKKTIFVNLGEEIFRGATQKLGGIIPGQEKIDPISGKGTGELTPLGRILRGTPLGVDPAKLALDRSVSAQDRNTKATEDLTVVMQGGRVASPGGGTPPFVGGTSSGSGSGGILGTILGGLGIGGTQSPGLILRNFTSSGQNAQNIAAGGLDFRPDQGLGGFLTKVTDFVRPKINPTTGKPGFSAGNTALAAAAALPAIIGGIQEGGTKGALGSISGALGVAASIPGPQQPFLIAGALITGLIGGLVKSKAQKKEEQLAAALNRRFELPGAVELTRDLAGNAVDYNSRGELRTYERSGNTIQVNVSAMDAKSFFERGPELSDSVMNMLQLDHPLRSQIREIAGTA